MSELPPQSVSPVSPSPPPLEYDRTPNHVTRGQFRVFLILLAINTVAIVGYLWAPNSVTWAQQAWKDFEAKRAAKAKEQQKLEAQRKRIDDFQKALPALAAMKLPAETPVYTEDGVEAASLLASDPAYHTVPLDHNGMPTDAWQAAVGRDAPPQAAAVSGFVGGNRGRDMTLLLHARKNPAGATRLVWCELDARQSSRLINSQHHSITTSRSLRVRLIDPGSQTDPPKLLHLVDTRFDQGEKERAVVKPGEETKTPQTFRFFAGVPDASDATRVTLPYQVNGSNGTIVVRVLEDDRLLVEPAEGRISERSGRPSFVAQTWDPSAPPALRLTESAP